MKTITMCFKLNFFNNNVKGNVHEQVHSREGVPLTISYHPYLRRISKDCSMLYHGSMGRVQNFFTHTFQALFCCFSSKNLCFIIFISLFYEASNFCNRILTNQKLEQVIRNCQWNCMQNINPLQTFYGDNLISKILMEFLLVELLLK